MVFDQTKLVLAAEALREACKLANDRVRHLDGLIAAGGPGSKPEDERALEDVRTQAQAAIAELADARSTLSAIRERHAAEPGQRADRAQPVPSCAAGHPDETGCSD